MSSVPSAMALTAAWWSWGATWGLALPVTLRWGGAGACALFLVYLLNQWQRSSARGCNRSCTVVDVPVSCSDVQQTSRVMLGSTVVTCCLVS